jgi:hypothetical protein
MRRSLLLLVAMALIPVASAQTGQFTPTMEISQIDVSDVSAEGVATAEVYVTFECPFTTPDFMANYVFELRVMADEPEVIISGAATKILSQACFSAIPGQSSSHELLWNFTLDGSQVYQDATVLFQAEVHASQEGSGPFYGPPDDAEADFTVKYQAQEDPAPLSNETAKPIPQEETTPGPALPLLIAGLVALARRRQA